MADDLDALIKQKLRNRELNNIPEEKKDSPPPDDLTDMVKLKLRQREAGLLPAVEEDNSFFGEVSKSYKEQLEDIEKRKEERNSFVKGVSGVGQDIKDIAAGIVALPVRAYESLADPEANSKKDLLNFGEKAVASSLASIGATASDPIDRLIYDPISTITDVLSIAAPAAKGISAAKGVSGAAAVAKELGKAAVNTGLSASGLDLVTPGFRQAEFGKLLPDISTTYTAPTTAGRLNSGLTNLGQQLLDSRIGVAPENLKAIEDFKTKKAIPDDLSFREELEPLVGLTKQSAESGLTLPSTSQLDLFKTMESVDKFKTKQAEQSLVLPDKIPLRSIEKARKGPDYSFADTVPEKERMRYQGDLDRLNNSREFLQPYFAELEKNSWNLPSEVFKELQDLKPTEFPKSFSSVEDLNKKSSLVHNLVEAAEREKLYNELSKSTDFLNKTSYEALDPSIQKRFIQVPVGRMDSTGKLNKFGSLAGNYVSRPLYNYLEQVDRTFIDPGSIENFILSAKNKFATAKVVLNPASWFNAIAGNAINNAMLAGLAPTFDNGIRVLFDYTTGKEVLKAAKDAGIVQAGDLLKNPNKVKAILKESDKPTALMKLMNQGENAIDSIKTIFSGIDNLSRLAAFNEGLKRYAVSQGLSPSHFLNGLTPTAEAVQFAKKVVEQIHPSYDDVPILLSKADKYGALPFSRYAWKSVGVGRDLLLSGTKSRAASREYNYNYNTDKTKKSIEQAPDYLEGKIVPTKEGGYINTSNFVPWSNPIDVLVPRSLRDRADVSDRSTGGGILGAAAAIAKGVDPATNKAFSPLATGSTKGSALRAIEDLILPGAFSKARNESEKEDGGDLSKVLGINRYTTPEDFEKQKTMDVVLRKKAIEQLQSEYYSEFNKLQKLPEKERARETKRIDEKYRSEYEKLIK